MCKESFKRGVWDWWNPVWRSIVRGATKSHFFSRRRVTVKRRGRRGRRGRTGRVREKGARRSSFDFTYASGRLYIALEAREGTISISFDKNKHCRGTVRADLCLRQQNTFLRDALAPTWVPRIRRTGKQIRALLNWIQVQSSGGPRWDSMIGSLARLYSFKQDICIIRDIASDGYMVAMLLSPRV